MTADAVQLAIVLIDRVGIESVAPGGHAPRDHPVGKGCQIDPEELGSALHLCFFGLSMPWLGWVG
jgi:hypothetical protein